MGLLLVCCIGNQDLGANEFNSPHAFLLSVYLGIGGHKQFYMKKNYLYLLAMVMVAMFSFASCSSDDDDNNRDPQTETEILQTYLKNKFIKSGVEAYQFVNDTEVNVWTDIVGDYQYYKYLKGIFKVYPEKQYIVINTKPETLLYYEIKNGIVYLYTDAEKKNNITNTEKPKELENESKQPNKDAVILSLDTHYTDFNTRDFINNDYTERTMYVKDKKTNETILTFHWYNYNDMPQIGRVDVKNRGNLLVNKSGSLYIRNITDSKGNIYAFNTTTNNVVKAIRTVQTANTMEKTTTLSVNLEGKFVGEIGIVFYN